MSKKFNFGRSFGKKGYYIALAEHTARFFVIAHIQAPPKLIIASFPVYKPGIWIFWKGANFLRIPKEIPLFGSSGKWEKINKNFVAIGIDKRGNLDYIYTVRVYTDWDLVTYRNGGG